MNQAVILAGGLGTRISEESHLRPKPMIEIGGKPILWHIMKLYGHYGINNFVICLGYKGYLIKEYFHNYFLHSSDITINIKENSLDVHKESSEPWSITLIDTGADTQTGGRLKRVGQFLDEEFCLTYGDGVSNVDIQALLQAHRESGLMATVTAVKPAGRYGALKLSESKVISFEEKPSGDGHWINGGFFVCKKDVLELVEGDQTAWEADPLMKLVEERNLGFYQHQGFWGSLDTMRDKANLEAIWSTGAAPWKVWT